MNKTELDTPVLIVDLDVMENNIQDMANAIADAGINLRPMIKTHKCAAIAHLQLEEPVTIGIQTAKLAEAEAMAASGVKDIFISNELIGEAKLERLMNLAKTHKISTSIDSFEGAKSISTAAQKHNTIMDVLIHIDTGNGRSGVLPGDQALSLSRRVIKLPGLNIKGIWTHEGHNYLGRTPDEVTDITIKAGKEMVKTRRLIEKELKIEVYTSVGSTPGAKPLSRMAGIDEVRPGAYVFNDENQVEMGFCQRKDCALSVLTTVFSRPTSDRIVCDAGSKSYYPPGSRITFDKEGAHLRTKLSRTAGGVVKRSDGEIIEDIVFHRWAEEYGLMKLYNPTLKVNIGDKFEIVPYHCCDTINLHDQIVGIRSGQVEVIWPITARGKAT